MDSHPRLSSAITPIFTLFVLVIEVPIIRALSAEERKEISDTRSMMYEPPKHRVIGMAYYEVLEYEHPAKVKGEQAYLYFHHRAINALRFERYLDARTLRPMYKGQVGLRLEDMDEEVPGINMTTVLDTAQSLSRHLRKYGWRDATNRFDEGSLTLKRLLETNAEDNTPTDTEG